MNQKKIFSKIYDDHIERIYRFIFLKVNSEDIAKDLCSETFVRAWDYFRGNKKKIDNPQAFLYQVARNLVTDHYREKGKVQTVQIDNLPVVDDSKGLEEESLEMSDLGQIQLAMSNIKPEYQDIVAMRYVEDLSVSEIAKILNKSEGNIRVTIYRALKAIRDEVKEV